MHASKRGHDIGAIIAKYPENTSTKPKVSPERICYDLPKLPITPEKDHCSLKEFKAVVNIA